MITGIRIQAFGSPELLRLGLTRKVPLAGQRDNPHGQLWKKLTLQVGGKSFDAYDAFEFRDETDTSNALQWQNPGLSWTGGQKVQARLFYNDQPSVPRNVRGFIGDNRITLNWDAPSSWGSGTAGGFQIEWKPADRTAWSRTYRAGSVYDPDASVSSFVFSGRQQHETLDPRTVNNNNVDKFNFRIRAVSANPKGASDWVEVPQHRSATVTLSASPTTVWEGKASRVTATLSNPLPNDVWLGVTVTPCPSGSWCHRFNSYPIYIPAGRTVWQPQGPGRPECAADTTHPERL